MILIDEAVHNNVRRFLFRRSWLLERRLFVVPKA
jgi:hypothetical protein